MKKLLTSSVKGLIGILATAILTNWITGQPLTGLIRLKGLYQTFIKSSVPAWAFAVVFLIALFGLYYTLTHLPTRRPRGKLHFFPDANNNGWSSRSDGLMDVRISGTLTYEGSGTLEILKVFLKKTMPTTDLLVRRQSAEMERAISASNIWIANGRPVSVFTHLTLKPAIGKPGQPLRARIVLRDKFNRDFVLKPVEFQYMGVA